METRRGWLGSNLSAQSTPCRRDSVEEKIENWGKIMYNVHYGYFYMLHCIFMYKITRRKHMDQYNNSTICSGVLHLKWLSAYNHLIMLHICTVIHGG